jgi:catechol 2,3-dioxygenase-like lactoylglutathione lyase family enzyme
VSDAESPLGAPAAITHIAIRTHDIGASVDFYRRYPGFAVTHERVDNGTRVVWMASEPDDPDFVIVLLQMPHEGVVEPGATDHYGFAVASREDIDRIAVLARSDGTLKYGPADLGPIVGYIVMVRDPSGNTCEFSHGQPIRTKDLLRAPG